MSFLSMVRDEILDNSNNNCCKKAEIYASLIGAVKYSDDSLRIISENAAISQSIVNLFKKVYKTEIILSVSNSGNKYTAKITKDVLTKLNIDYYNELDSIIQKDCCKKAFIKTLFLVCGNISDPEKEYRIEFILRDVDSFDCVNSILNSLGYAPKKVVKNNKYVLYFKDCTSLEEILTYLSATDCSLKLMEIEVEKTVKNYTNRKANFEQANFCKTYNISQKQINAIKLIKQKGMYSQLNENLKFVALLREQNEDSSLNDLSEISGISRSSINKRLNKLIEIAESIED